MKLSITTFVNEMILIQNILAIKLYMIAALEAEDKLIHCCPNLVLMYLKLVNSLLMSQGHAMIPITGGAARPHSPIKYILPF